MLTFGRQRALVAALQLALAMVSVAWGATAVAASGSSSVTPEQLRDWFVAGEPFELRDAATVPVASTAVPDPAHRIVYYDVSVSHRASRHATQRARAHGESATVFLSGTPLQWKQLQLPHQLAEATPAAAVSIDPRDLSDALDQEIPISLIDLRSAQIVERSSVPGATQLLPHQVRKALESTSKKNWIALIDNGEGVARLIAEELYRDGFKLVGALEGGYPAWAAREVNSIKNTKE